MTRQPVNHVGVGFKARPALLTFQGTPVARVGVLARWAWWLANGWQPTTIAVTIIAVLTVTASFPVLMLGGLITIALTVTRRPIIFAGLASTLTTGLAVITALSGLDTTGYLILVGLLAVWPVDALVGFKSHRYRNRRLWAEFRRGFPVRFATMAAKSTRIQGPLDGEQQLPAGARPILDHPALDQRAVFDGDTVWCRCSVSPGRKHEALREILAELAASFVHVQRIDLIAVDDHQSFGHLVVRFGPPLLTDQAPDTSQTDQLRAVLYQAPAYVGIATAVAATTWLAIT